MWCHLLLEALVGQVAEAATEIEREGLVRHGGELWTATANGHRISKGTRVSIVGVQGTKLAVRPIHTEPMTHRIGAPTGPADRRDRKESGE